MRRTGTYFHWLVITSAPASVRAPHRTGPMAGNVRKQLRPSGLSWPFSWSESW